MTHAGTNSRRSRPGERIAEAGAARWLSQNGDAIEASNAYADAHGLPLAAFRLF